VSHQQQGVGASEIVVICNPMNLEIIIDKSICKVPKLNKLTVFFTIVAIQQALRLLIEVARVAPLITHLFC
jgi:hypothetical protein